MDGRSLIILLLIGIAFWAFSGRKKTKAGRAVKVRGHGHGTQRLIAKHEAGHAAAARGLGGSVRSARIWKNGGLVQANIPDGPEAAVTFLIAGQIAAGTSEGASADNSAIKRELRGLSGSERSRIKRKATSRARSIVSSASGRINRDADKLERKGKL